MGAIRVDQCIGLFLYWDGKHKKRPMYWSTIRAAFTVPNLNDGVWYCCKICTCTTIPDGRALYNPPQFNWITSYELLLTTLVTVMTLLHRSFSDGVCRVCFGSISSRCIISPSKSSTCKHKRIYRLKHSFKGDMHFCSGYRCANENAC